jgi:hypothetical protein
VAAKKGKDRGTQADAGADVFGEDILRELDEMLLNEPTAAGRHAGSTRSSAQPAPVPPPKPKGDPGNRRKAEELAAQAKNIPERKKAAHVAKQALALDHNCVDAWVILAHARATAPDELAEGLEKAVERGERGLGQDFLDHYRGKVWAQPSYRIEAIGNRPRHGQACEHLPVCRADCILRRR